MGGGSGASPEECLITAQAEGPPPLVLVSLPCAPLHTGPLSPLNATGADAGLLGADTVGYTLYVGSPAHERDFGQYRQVREDAQRFGVSLIGWSCPHGKAIEAKGGKDCSDVDYAGRTAGGAMPQKAREPMGAGLTGPIPGRNIWQRERGESLCPGGQLKDILATYSSG